MTAKNLIKLNSVGCYLNTETLQTCADIKFPSGECVHLDECSDEWFLSLGIEDYIEVKIVARTHGAIFNFKS